MKHSVLRNIAHNLADSLASGCSLLVGAYELDIFGEARKAENGCLIVDFLHGTVSGGDVTSELGDAVNAINKIVPEFCTSHGANLEDFLEMKAHFFSTLTKNRVTIFINDKTGRHSKTEYQGTPAKRIMEMDALGRLRPKRPEVTTLP